MINGWIDLRSDTVTHPTPAMWEAMAHAELGDDVYGEDPTVNELEARAARLLGKEAAVFVPTGTMGNLASLLAHCERGDEIIVGDKAHIFVAEQGGAAALGGIQVHTLPNQPDGTLRLEDIEGAIRRDDPHFPRTRLICLENTHNICYGSPLSLDYTRAVGELARRHGLKLHMDGARLFNAATALGVAASELVAPADSVSFCLSKGLCCPAGSLICGEAEFVRRARRARKVLGAAMRQVGILAAAGLVALDSMIGRLAEDHARACQLAEGLRRVPGIELDLERVQTNIVYFDLSEAAGLTTAEVIERLKERRVRVGARSGRRFRAVTHYWVTDEDVARTVEAFEEALSTER
jgi:threonine aldolase